MLKIISLARDRSSIHLRSDAPDGPMHVPKWPRLFLAAATVVVVAGCGGGGGGGGGGGSPEPRPTALACDDTLKTQFKPDALTSVLVVKAFAKGDPLLLSGTPTGSTPTAQNDICFVKLNVGPGSPGPAGAPSTSPGITVEIWLPKPANWNQRLHATGPQGWSGGDFASLTTIGSLGAQVGSPSPPTVAGVEGAVSATTDAGHSGSSSASDWAMNPDGTLNTATLRDLATRGVHETAVKAKALAEQYYGRPPKYSYHEGGSGGGRHGMALAQYNPKDYDGIIALYPSNNTTRFITGELYPQILFQRELGGVPLTTAQQDLISNAAISSCDLVGGQHLGYLVDPSQCRYDPSTDLSVLCASDGGTNATSACVTKPQAHVVNKIWHGMTGDGTAPSPATDNGWSLTRDGNHYWWGLARGTSLWGRLFAPGGLNGLASPNGPFPIASGMVALELQNPTIADTSFKNASGNGADGWKHLTYAQLANAYDRGIALQDVLGNWNADNPDLSAFKARGGKLLVWHGLADELIPAQGSIDYFNRVVATMGGLQNVQDFYRMYLVPGVGHGTPNGTANASATPPTVGAGVMYGLMTNWVEKGVAPDRIDLVNATRSMPICVYPKKITYVSGNPFAGSSYSCS